MAMQKYRWLWMREILIAQLGTALAQNLSPVLDQRPIVHAAASQ